MGRRLDEVTILCMAPLGWWVSVIMALLVLGSIFSYSSALNTVLLSGLDHCLARLLWKAHTILINWLNASSLSSYFTAPPAHCGSMLTMSFSYSYLGSEQRQKNFLGDGVVSSWVQPRYGDISHRTHTHIIPGEQLHSRVREGYREASSGEVVQIASPNIRPVLTGGLKAALHDLQQGNVGIGFFQEMDLM